MAEVQLMGWSVSMTASDYAALSRHLLRDDEDEHAAFCYAGVAETSRGTRLLVRRVVPVADVDFPLSPGAGYRRIVPRAVARAAIECDAEGLCLVWVHSHPGSMRAVELSPQDRRTAADVHPALSDLTHGRPVTALVFGVESAAGQVGTSDGVQPIEFVRVVGSPVVDLRPKPLGGIVPDERFARQVLLFGDVGQRRLRDLVVAVVGVGGGGSLIVQSLAHLGVGGLVLIDHDVVKRLNLSRIVGATLRDVGGYKVDVLARLVRDIDPSIDVRAVRGDVTYATDAQLLAGVDAVFLATDTAFARHAVNLVCHQYVVPFFQVGAKVSTDPTTGVVDLIHVVARPYLFMSGCMHCAGVVPLDQLQHEQQSDEENRAQDYLGTAGRDVEDPSVITLNSIAASIATTDFLLTFTGLAQDDDPSALVCYPLERQVRSRRAPARPRCAYCDALDPMSAFARGETWPLQLRPGASPGFARPVPRTGLFGAFARWLRRDEGQHPPQ